MAFEAFRNNTNVFKAIADWRVETEEQYKTRRIDRILSLYQFQLCRYMVGEGLGDNIMPRGLLVYWKPGSGKTLGFIAAGLYALSKKSREYNKGILVVITNKSL